MTIVKKKAKKKNFSIIDNEGLHSRDLSWQATGLWAWFMSKPDDWEVSLEHLCKSKVNGKDSTLSALAELEELGYLIYQRWRNTTGQFESAYTVFESPEQLTEWKETADPNELSAITKVSRTKKHKKSTAEKPQGSFHSGKPAVDKPLWNSQGGTSTVENPQQLNIDKQSTELKSTELPIPPNPPTGGTEESGGEENSASLEEPGSPTKILLPEQPCQQSDSTNDNANHGDKDSAPARDNSTRYVRNQPQYPKNIDGSDRLPWDTQERGVFDAGFEKHMTRSLKGYPSYQGLLEGELQTKVRKHISGGRHDMKRRDELIIEWNAYQISLVPKPSITPQVSYEPLPEKKCWVPPLEQREAFKKQLRAKKAGLK